MEINSNSPTHKATFCVRLGIASTSIWRTEGDQLRPLQAEQKHCVIRIPIFGEKKESP